MGLYKPICMPEVVAVPSFVAYPGSSSLLMRFVFHKSFLFEDPMDPVMTNEDNFFSKDLLQGDCVKRMLVSYL